MSWDEKRHYGEFSSPDPESRIVKHNFIWSMILLGVFIVMGIAIAHAWITA